MSESKRTDFWIAVGTMLQVLILSAGFLYAVFEFRIHREEAAAAAAREAIHLHANVSTAYQDAIVTLRANASANAPWTYNATPPYQFAPQARIVGDKLLEAALCDNRGACDHGLMLTLWCGEAIALVYGSAKYPNQSKFDPNDSTHRKTMMDGPVPGLVHIEGFVRICSKDGPWKPEPSLADPNTLAAALNTKS
jgi:hypothetical protein